jgi:hypothetical protein
MGAASVTGVGQGSAGRLGTKGSEHLFMGVEKLIGTRIVYSGTIALVGGAATHTFSQPLPGEAGDYIVLTGSIAHSYASAVTTTSVTFVGTGTQTISFAVIRLSDATVASFPTHD